MKNALYVLGILGFGTFIASYYLKKQSVFARDVATGRNLLDLNKASEEDILALDGIDPELASRILENRPYVTKVDLIGRMIIPEDIYNQIKHSVTVRHVA